MQHLFRLSPSRQHNVAGMTASPWCLHAHQRQVMLMHAGLTAQMSLLPMDCSISLHSAILGSSSVALHDISKHCQRAFSNRHLAQSRNLVSPRAKACNSRVQGCQQRCRKEDAGCTWPGLGKWSLAPQQLLTGVACHQTHIACRQNSGLQPFSRASAQTPAVQGQEALRCGFSGKKPQMQCQAHMSGLALVCDRQVTGLVAYCQNESSRKVMLS